jgi:hypothetical protein
MIPAALMRAPLLVPVLRHVSQYADDETTCCAHALMTSCLHIFYAARCYHHVHYGHLSTFYLKFYNNWTGGYSGLHRIFLTKVPFLNHLKILYQERHCALCVEREAPMIHGVSVSCIQLNRNCNPKEGSQLTLFTS